MRAFVLAGLLSALAVGGCAPFSQAEDDVVPVFDLSGPDHSATVCPDPYDTSMAGEPCAPDGISCAHCSDPCVACSGFVCKDGQWVAFESFPMICG